MNIPLLTSSVIVSCFHFKTLIGNVSQQISTTANPSQSSAAAFERTTSRPVFILRGCEGSKSCGCPNGYRKKFGNSSCEDIDECEYESCDPQTSICKNLEGSFECDCLSGFYPNGDTCVANDSILVGGGDTQLVITVFVIMSTIILSFLLGIISYSIFKTVIPDDSGSSL